MPVPVHCTVWGQVQLFTPTREHSRGTSRSNDDDRSSKVRRFPAESRPKVCLIRLLANSAKKARQSTWGGIYIWRPQRFWIFWPLPPCPHSATDLYYKIHATSLTLSALGIPSPSQWRHHMYMPPYTLCMQRVRSLLSCGFPIRGRTSLHNSSVFEPSSS